LKIIPRLKPDLVIMDVRMGGISGLETLRRLRQLDAKQMVIMMTAYGTTQTAIEAMKLGAYDYLLKPFDVPRLKQFVLNALKAARDMRQVVSYSRCWNRRITIWASSGGASRCRMFSNHRPTGGQQRHRLDHRRKRHGQGTGRPRHLSSQQTQRPDRSWPSTAPPSRKTCWKANCSDTKRARSPARPRSASANSSNATTARFFWTRLAT
jgi:DNA-binding response OmpR family regulator